MKQIPRYVCLTGMIFALLLASEGVFAHSTSFSANQKEALYSHAVRKEPKLDLTDEKEQKALNDGLQAVTRGDKQRAIELLQPLVEHSKSKYAQALALQGLADLRYNNGDLKGAITLMTRALALGVMPNDTYFQLQFMLAQFYLADGQYQQTLNTLAQWRAEGKKETADAYAVEGSAYYHLRNYPEAIAAIKKALSLADKPNENWQQLLMASYAESGQSEQAVQLARRQLAAHPHDPSTFNNAVAVLMQTQKYPEAIQLLEKARAQGTLKAGKDYINLAKLYLVVGQSGTAAKPNAQKAVQVLNEGFRKSLILQNADNLKLLGDANYMAEQPAQAIKAYREAIPLAKDGQPAISAGQLLIIQGSYKEARTLLQQGIAKGVPHRGQAYMLLAEANRELKDRSAAIAAMKHAAQDPETAAAANKWLQQVGVQ